MNLPGGAIDKSWLFLEPLNRNMERKLISFKTSFAAPPLINGLLKNGDLDAGINYWNYVARLEGQGFKSILSIEDILPILGINGDLPL